MSKSTFETVHDFEGTHLFSWSDAKDAYEKGITNNGKTYYLPSSLEWQAIIPGGLYSDQIIDFGSEEVIILENESCIVDGIKYSTSGTFQSIDGKVYAVMNFTPEGSTTAKYHVAYTYAFDAENFGLAISSTQLMEEEAIETIANESYWSEKPDKEIAHRFLPAAGYYYYSDDDTFGTSEEGHYWAADSESNLEAYAIEFNEDFAFGKISEKMDRQSVRLFIKK